MDVRQYPIYAEPLSIFSVICLPGQFQCHDNKKGVAPGSLCDGAEDCWDASDEKFCTSDFRSNASSAQVNSMTGR
ncbi:hypothetical protein ANCCAN_25845 [Ancylostoma caninum]|uniref:Low-density lipoprotein receptor domain class A n=1 Tax=Ancylostoma caninum TaxID=29170 RepID=A0A368F8I3_ANCCA|nr:hypothetical protein ANCCAN_25845 [Ancylostoma caninum]